MKMNCSTKGWAMGLAILVSLLLIGSTAWSSSDWRDSDRNSRRTSSRVDRDGDGFTARRGCNDKDPSVYPSAPEIADDGIDQDCSGDGVKRGDLSMATITNADRRFDVHMNAAGSDLDCQSCHVFKDHKVIGKGSDLRPTDDLSRGSEVSCLTCHTDKNSREGHDTEKVNDHVARVACQTCHIPVYAKVATETYRDWQTHHDGSPADASAAPGHPFTEKMADLTPTYKFWNRKSDNALLGDDASRTYNWATGTWPTSTPLGDVTDGLLNHGVNPASDALQCADCHGRIDRIDLQGDLGYQLKADKSSVCSQCHGQKENKSFAVIHDKHVKDKKYDCSRCHTFSRPERG